jgi:hypothetical protein
MYQTLINQSKVLKDDGWIFCTVGNSLHGSSHNTTLRIPIASDLIIAYIASKIGLEVQAVQVARYLDRRKPKTKYLRESTVVLRRRTGYGGGSIRRVNNVLGGN